MERHLLSVSWRVALTFKLFVRFLFRFCLTIGLLAISGRAFCHCSDWENLFFYKHVSLNDASTDRFGNTYIVGSFFEDDFTIGLNTFPLPPGGWGAFIAKFDKNHSLIWALSPTVDTRASAEQIEIDQNDDIIVAGNFGNSISFNCVSFARSNNPTWANRDLFVAKLTPDGVPLWITGSESSDDCQVARITMSPNGNCILIANFVEKSFRTPGLTAPDIEMGGVPVITGAADQLNAGLDSFVASILPDGTVAWTHGIGGDGNHFDYAQDVGTDSKSNILVTGYFSSDHISFDGQLVHGFATNNYYLAKIDPDGQTLWVRGTENTNVNQKGRGVDIDDQDNIFVTGGYFGDATFGPFTLPGQGDTDVFVVKFTSDGIPINAAYVGSNGYDEGTAVAVNSAGQLIVSANSNSTYLEVGSFSSSNPEDTGTDAFVATFSNDLATVECVKFITGAGELFVRDVELDAFDNISVIVEFMSLMSTGPFEVKLHTHTFTDPDYRAVLAIIGNNPASDQGEIPDPFSLRASLGKETTLCTGGKLTLSVPSYCNAEYTWNTGETGSSIDVVTPGHYWLDVTVNGYTVRGDVTITAIEPILVSLGDDQFICVGETVSWDLPVYKETTYTWSDGSSLNHNSVTGAGTVWIEVANRCESVRETVTLHEKPLPEINLGSDIVTCEKKVVLTHTPDPGHSLHWSDGSTSPTLMVTRSGLYQLTVDNGCEEATGEVQVTIKGQDDFVIPNVVTFNADGINDRFTLPSNVETYSLSIFNRWGQKVFSANDYQNNWPSESLSEGVYFYTLKGECTPTTNGVIHLIR